MIKKVLTVALIGLMSACGTTGADRKNTIIIALGAEAVTMDPYKSNDSASSQVRDNIFDTLIEQDANGAFVPRLATEWTYINPTNLELKLREGVIFHNGESFTAQDVQFSLERALKSPEVEHIVSPIKGVTIVDDYTVQINLHEPFAPIFAHLSHPAIAMMNQKAVEADEKNVGQKPVGTSAFKLKSWNRGQNLVLEANTNYWGEAPKIAFVEMRVVPEPSARTIALETGDVDVIYTVDPVDRERISNNDTLQLIEKESPRIEYLAANIGKNKNTIWQDARVREALALAIDVPGIIQSVVFGAASPAGSMLQSAVFGSSSFPVIQRDVERAKRLLKEAGVEPGTKVSLWTPSGYREKVMQVVQNNLKEIGLDASINVLEWGRYLSTTANGDHDLFVLGWTTLTLDADYGLYNLLHSKAFGAAGNRTFYSNAQVDTLLDQARSEGNTTKRAALYKQLLEIVRKDSVLVNLYHPFESVGLKKSIKDFGYSVKATHNFKKMYKEEN